MSVNKFIYMYLADYLDQYHIKIVWASLLANYITGFNNKELNYILLGKDFVNSSMIEKNLLNGLSMGEIAGLYEFSLAHCNSKARKLAGQYFTPDDVAAVMAKKAIKNFSDGYQKNKIWCDPCVGIGNLAYYLIANQKNPESFLQKNIFFIDKDRLALFIARTLLTIKFQQKNKNLFWDIKKKFITADFLLNHDVPNFDYALFNPPYGKIDKTTSRQFISSDIYAQFIEAVIKKIAHRGGGFVSITPQSFTHAEKFFHLRKLLLSSGKKLTIYNFDNVPDNIFYGKKFGSGNSNQVNSTRAAITIFHHRIKFDKAIYFSITPLLRWRTAERSQLLASIDSFLTIFENPQAKIFPKMQAELKDIYYLMLGKKTLSTVLSKMPTDYFLFVPTTPRYFISALRYRPHRTSCRMLYFVDSDSRDIAYILLNSSFCYWWWRVHDGGMTLSKKTLHSLPFLLQSPPPLTILKELQLSEKNNKVIKKNAGHDNENVKHSPSLIDLLNRQVAKNFCNVQYDGQMFLSLHHNTVL
ncbi:MAG: Eco57I restriction-modification methylase domain-containing protein [Alphaproteobacteria bacterium]